VLEQLHALSIFISRVELASRALMVARRMQTVTLVDMRVATG